MDGKYVVKFGRGYLRHIKENVTFAEITIVLAIDKADFLELDQALKIKEKFGGKVLKIGLELEEV